MRAPTSEPISKSRHTLVSKYGDRVLPDENRGTAAAQAGPARTDNDVIFHFAFAFTSARVFGS